MYPRSPIRDINALRQNVNEQETDTHSQIDLHTDGWYRNT